MNHMHRRSIASKTSSDYIIFVKPFPGDRIKTMQHYVSPHL